MFDVRRSQMGKVKTTLLQKIIRSRDNVFNLFNQLDFNSQYTLKKVFQNS